MARKNIKVGVAFAAMVLATGCAQVREQRTPGSFSSVRPVLEMNCVHCHGTNHLPQMPAFSDTRTLARLIGPANWIVPGHPERSRLFKVVTLTDEQAGAMPPTGHAISKADIEKLRAWISAGAQVPDGTAIALVPNGEPPRSR